MEGVSFSMASMQKGISFLSKMVHNRVRVSKLRQSFPV